MDREAVGAGYPPVPAPFPHVPLPLALLGDKSLAPGAVLMWSWLYRYAMGSESTVFEMSVEEMMNLCDLSKGSVNKYRAMLIESGWLEVTILHGLGRKQQVTVKVPGQEVYVAAD